jgi:carboxylate-amine ligase
VHPSRPPLTEEAVRAAFDGVSRLTVGVEDEVMLLDPETDDLMPAGDEVLARIADNGRFRREFVASQLEIGTAVCRGAGAAAAELLEGRRTLRDLLAGEARLAAAGTHPFADAVGVLTPGRRFEALADAYRWAAPRALVSAMHIHVAVPGADRALAVHNALRSYLPELAALAANAPFYEGRDSGLASVRSRISGLLPRQGVPPALPTWDAYEEALRWCAFEDPRQWWWELRLHPVLGTLEVRVPDTQASVADTAAVAAVVHTLATRLAARHDAGEALPVAESWRIDQNRWSACRHGVDGTMRDLFTGAQRPTRERLAALLDELDLEPEAHARARGMLSANGAVRQRAVGAERGLHGLVGWLADGFAPAGVSPADGVG